jgi:signal transduction histidine kinase/CheY-like chemotaxis protein
VSAHHLLPLLALALNLGLLTIALIRNPGSRLNRTFAYFVAALALWNFGVFMLRRAPDVPTAWTWEVVIHVGVTALPALYYHFVLIFLESTRAQRFALAAAYGVSAAFGILNLLGHRAFLAGVQSTRWGWAPVPGPWYRIFLLAFYGYLLAALIHLVRAYRGAGSGFRRNRILLILLGTAVTMAGGFIDIIRFALAEVAPAVERLYPLGIPANTACAVMFAIAIVRYRMFAVSRMVKKAAVYGLVGVVVTGGLIALTHALEEALGLAEITAVWLITPLGFLFALLLTPLGRPLTEGVERLMFHRARGCQETLVALSRRLATMLDLDEATETLVRGLVRGIPLTHCALLLREHPHEDFELRRAESSTGETAGVTTLRADSGLVRWLERSGGVLVTEEANLNRRLARTLGLGDVDTLGAALVVGLKTEQALTGVLLLGEKLSGEIFDPGELELLAVLANQAAISMANARLYARAHRERHRVEVLYQLARRLATVHDTDELLAVIVAETRRLLGAELAAVRLVEGGELVLAAATESPLVGALRPRLGLGESLTGAVLAANSPVAVEDVLEDHRYDPDHRRVAEASGLHGFLGVPLRAQGVPVGVLYAYTRTRRVFTADEISLLAAFADQASVSLEKSRLAAERRRAEEALRQSEKLATMGQLLAGVAHELNNPLTVIVGWAALLRARLPNDPATDHIEAAAQHCSRIIRNFLALARKHPPERRRVALNAIVTEAVELLAYPLRVDNVTVSLDLAAELPELWADAHQLKQVVVNLLTNAHHALRQSAVRQLSLTTRYHAGRDRVVLRVADTGPGIPPELQGRIFEPFFTTKPVGEGTGLGLSLCHSIVESHGGTIGVESEPGRGAVFTVELPPGRGTEAGDGEAAERGLPVPAGRTVLVVDDDPAVAALLAQMLGADGHRVDTAWDARAALDRLGERAYDVVVSDLRMPQLDGPSFFREAARRFPGRCPPFVFVTGDILGAETLAFLAQTHAPCLHKPFGPEDLRRAMRAALGLTAPATPS